MTFYEICDIHWRLKSPKMVDLRKHSIKDFLSILIYIRNDKGRERCRKTYMFTCFLLKTNSYEDK